MKHQRALRAWSHRRSGLGLTRSCGDRPTVRPRPDLRLRLRLWLLFACLFLTGCTSGSWYHEGQALNAPPASPGAGQGFEPRPFSPALADSPNLLRGGNTSLIAGSRGSYVSEELWIISRPASARIRPPRAVADNEPAGGGLVTKSPDREEFIPVPLKHTAVTARIDAYVASVDVIQQFHNPFDTKIEAVYVFPLPDNAAINEFIMTIGDRRIRGVIRERAEAERLYRDARDQGRVATLMTQERPNIFTQKVANIEPGRQIDVSIRYFQTLAYSDGWYEFEFPMVVGPRFNPPMTTAGVGATPRDAIGSTGQQTQVPYLRPNERSGHDIALSLVLNPGVEIEELASVNHLVDQLVDESGRVLIQLSARDRIPNKDFVLRYRVAGDRLKTHFLAQRDARGGGYFTLMLYPPGDTSSIERHPMEMVFVIDASGSMDGRPFQQARDAVIHALKRLQPTDTFQVIRFAGSSSSFAPLPVEATSANVRQAIGYVSRLQTGGGTIMVEGVKSALSFDPDPDRLRFVCFLTDGYIGNEREVLRAVSENLGQSRIFSFGIGASPNRYLMNRMAKLGTGVAAYIALDESSEEVMGRFFDRVSKPVMRDLRIDWEGLNVVDVYPRRIPDLFAGRPVVLTGRYLPTQGAFATPLAKVSASHADETIELTIPVDVDHAQSHNSLANVWARAKLADLSDELTLVDPLDEHKLIAAIRQTALDHNLMSAYTAFIAVDAAGRTAGDYGVTVHVPVPTPEGVNYETTVEGERKVIER